MAVSVVMPALELAQESGKLLGWLKKEGEAVAKGEPLVEIETDKAVFELESPGDGVLAGVKSGAGETVPVGQTIAWIVAQGEAPPVEDDSAVRAIAERARRGPARISPKARRLAEERGVDISQVRGTGPDGSITSDDVLAAAAAKAAPAPAAAVADAAAPAPLSSIARLMAERTTESWTHAPHFFLVREVDAGALLEAKQKLGAGYTVTDILVALTARTLAKHPRLNGAWTGEGVRLNPDVNITIAIAVEDGVVGAVIPKADGATLQAVAEQRRALAERARAGKLRPGDIAGGTFTISNLGMFGVDAFNAILTPPQAGILAVGRIAERVVPVNGAPGIRPMMTLTLSSDHRVVDGAQSARFLSDLADAIGEPGL